MANRVIKAQDYKTEPLKQNTDGKYRISPTRGQIRSRAGARVSVA